jgi:hypothetical protein
MSVWTDRIQFMMTGESDGFQPGSNTLLLAGGGNCPNRQLVIHHSSAAGLQAALASVYGAGSTVNPFFGIESLVSWSWVYAAQGHTATNAALEMRRAFGSVLMPSLAWEFMYKGGRLLGKQWTAGSITLVNGQEIRGDHDPYFAGYLETLNSGNTSYARPSGNFGYEMWPAPSATDPGVVQFRGGYDKTKMQSALAYAAGFQVRVIPRDPALPLDPPNTIKFIAAQGADFYGDRAFASHTDNGGICDGPNSRWVKIPSTGEWVWIMFVTFDTTYNDTYRPPFAAAASLPNYTGSWPYNNAPTYARTLAQIIANPPTDMIAYYADGGVVTPPVVPPVGVLVPGAATRPVFGPKVVSTYKDFGDKNRTDLIAPVWQTLALASALSGAAYVQPLLVTASPASTITIVSGNPGWLSITTPGGVPALSGTVPAGQAIHTLVLRATSAGFSPVDITLQLTVNEPGIITTTVLPGGVAGDPYNVPLQVSGTGPFTWSVASGEASLTARGLTLSPGGTLSGTLIAGALSFTARATGPFSTFDDQAYSITFGSGGQEPIVTKTSMVSGTTGIAYTDTITATGAGTVTRTIVAGSLPPGLSMAGTTGVVSGTPTQTGTFVFAVRPSSTYGTGPDVTLSITIYGPAAIAGVANPFARLLG